MFDDWGMLGESDTWDIAAQDYKKEVKRRFNQPSDAANVRNISPFFNDIEGLLNDANRVANALGDPYAMGKLAPELLLKILAVAIIHRAGSGGEAPKVHMGKQGKHIPGHNNFEPGRSVLRADPESLASQAGTGEQVGKIPVGQAGSKERVIFDDVIGDYIDPSGVVSPTRVGIFHYSKDGIHIVPGRPQ